MADAADMAADYQARHNADALSRRRPYRAVQYMRCECCKGRNDQPERRLCSDCITLTAAERDALAREVALG